MRRLWLLLWYFFARFLPGHSRKSITGRMRSAVARRCLGQASHSSVIGYMVDFGDGRNISIGEKSGIGSHSVVKGSGEIRIGDNVTMGPGVMILSSSHSFTVEDDRWAGNNSSRPISIESECFIAAGSIVLAGVRIGPRSIVAAGSIVVQDVPAGAMVGGVPARVIKQIAGPLGHHEMS